jgi:hypothetical protein
MMKDLRCSLLAIFLPGASPGAVVLQGEDKVQGMRSMDRSGFSFVSHDLENIERSRDNVKGGA